MQLWLVCCLILFIATEGWQRLSHVDLSLPLVLIGGIGLAIGSQSWPRSIPPPAPSSQAVSPPSPQRVIAPPSRSRRSSISFEIAKPKAKARV